MTMPVSPTSFDGQLLFSIQAAAAQHPASSRPGPWRDPAPVRNESWDQVRLQTPVPYRMTTHTQVSLPKPQPKPVIKPTQTSIGGQLAPVSIPRWTTSPALTVPVTPKKTSSSIWSTVGSWFSHTASGAMETVKYGLPFVGGRNDGFLASKQQLAVSVARTEYYMGVRERGATNTGKRVDVYAQACKMGTGQEWCGFFTGYAYSRNGFKEPEYMASGYKAQLFYLYRTMSGRDTDLSVHQAQGQTRHYFMLPESPSRGYIKENAKLFPQFDLSANTYTWDNLPVRAGDTILFEKGGRTGIPDHVGIVESYDRATGRLTTIEGNVSNQVVHKTYDLRSAAVRRTISGFGRPAPGDFV
jgi:hypothetical protein